MAFRYYVRRNLAGRATALFRVDGNEGQYLSPSGRWMTDSLVPTSVQWDTDIDEVSEAVAEQEAKRRSFDVIPD